tara:strand:- start:1930 stop:9402 length:7473 start_codon:yes stop_codon:yes gene_type:complete
MYDFIIVIVILAAIFLYSKFRSQQGLNEELVTTEYCDMDRCKNTCQNINASQRGPDGEFPYGLDSDGNSVPDMEFPAEDCDSGTKLIRKNDKCTGGDDSLPEEQQGEVQCTSDDCCIPKTCGSDILSYSLEDKKNYLLAINNITPEQSSAITNHEDLTREQNITLDQKIRRDSYCPYQQSLIDPNQPCLGADNGTGGDCSNVAGGECCEDKKCYSHWNNNDNTEWGETDTRCPHEPDSVRSNSDVTMMKKSDDTPCDNCDISECCYQQSAFCIVEANGDYSGANTNVQSVGFPDGITGISFPNDNSSVDLTTNYFLPKSNIENNTENIQDLLSFGEVDGNINSVNDFGIKCEDGFKYGMCSSTDSSLDEICKTHDNNQRECEAAGCSFTLGDRPRVDYSECGISEGETGTEDHNIIKVGSCINTCTADHELSDGDINYFTQTAITEGANIGSYRVNSLYDNTGKNSGQEFESGINIRKYCNNYFGTGEPKTYNYTCRGGGSYFTVDGLENCNSTCGELNSQGQNCAENKIYNPETNPDTNSLPSNFADFNEDCCIPKTCNNGSSGTDIGCRNYEKTIETETPIDSSGTELPINSNNCCERLTCNGYLNEFNRVSVEGGHEEITSENICNSGTFRPENLVSFNYLNNFRSGVDSDTEKYNIFKSYQTGDPIDGDTSVVDIGCCQQLTCQEWANHPGNIPGDDELQDRANRYCNNNGDGINVFDMNGTFNGNSLDEAVEPGNNSCCISSENITCSPSDELMNYTSLVGYDGLTNPPPDTIEFEYVPESTTFSRVVGENPFSGVTCQEGASGEPTLQCTHDTNGDNHRYTLTGCNVEPNENTCQEGQSLANGDPKFCVLPDLNDDTHHGVVLSDFITGVSGNAIVNVRNFAHQLDNIQCENSTSHPCMSECTNDVLTTSYSGVLTERNQADARTYSETDYDISTHMHIDGCDYQNDLSGDFFTDRYYNDDNGYSECNTLYQSRRMPDGSLIDTSKINVKHFKCHCEGTQEDPDQPNHGGQLAESCEANERHIRFKYVFDNSLDYLTDDKRHITNTEALNDPNPVVYNKTDIIEGDSICEPGYYPYRGNTEDYCKPCTDLYKNNHPISAIADRFCNSGHLFDSSGSISLLPRPDIGSTEYNSDISHQDISTLQAVRDVGGGTEMNEVYGAYMALDDINDDYFNDARNFMTPDKFTLGSRVCDNSVSEPCSPTVKIYDFSQGPPAEDSAFEKAEKWWRTYFNSNFNTEPTSGVTQVQPRREIDGSEITDIMSAPSDEGITEEEKPKLVYALQDRTSQSEDQYQEINDITLIRKNMLLNRNSLELRNNDGSQRTSDDGTRQIISTVCNNETSGADYIPSFDTVGGYEGECKECVNLMPSMDSSIWGSADHQGNRPSGYPLNSPGNLIVRNIKEEGAVPICDHRVGMYNETYNEGNITGFKKSGGGEIYDNTDSTTTPEDNPCKDGFIYNQDGFYHNVSNVEWESLPDQTKYIMCKPKNPILVPFCENIIEEDECNKSIASDKPNNTPGNPSENFNIEGESALQRLSDDDRNKIEGVKPLSYCGWNSDNGKCESIYPLDDSNYIINPFYKFNNQAGEVKGDWAGEIDLSKYKIKYHNQSVLEYLDSHITNYASSDNYDYSNFIRLDDINDKLGESYDTLGLTPTGTSELSIHSYGVSDNTMSNRRLINSRYLSKLSAIKTFEDGSDIYSMPRGDYDTSTQQRTEYDINNSITKTNEDIPSKLNELKPFSPTRINPENTRLNNKMENRCHPILWDGPVDFFYKKGDNYTISSSCYLREGSTRAQFNLSHQRDDGGWILQPIVPNDFKYNRGVGGRTGTDPSVIHTDNTDYSIKSTPLYYNKGRSYNGGTITDTACATHDGTNQATCESTGSCTWDSEGNTCTTSEPSINYIFGNSTYPGEEAAISKYTHPTRNPNKSYNILNPTIFENSNYEFGIQYAKRYLPNNSDNQYPFNYNNDSGFADAALFPLIDRVRSCHNDSLLYPGLDTIPDGTALGVSGDQNKDNEREQCIFHYDEIDRSEDLCVNACLNNNDCDLVRITKNEPENGKATCELLKWNRLPELSSGEEFKYLETGLEGGRPYPLDTDGNEVDTFNSDSNAETNPLKQEHLGGHLINGKTPYDETNLKGISDWLNRVKGVNAHEMDYSITEPGTYRTDYYTELESGSVSNTKQWRFDENQSYLTHVFKNDSGTSTENPKYNRGRELWVPTRYNTGNNPDREIWIAMNKIRDNQGDELQGTSQINDLFENINNHEMSNLQGGNLGSINTYNSRQSVSLGTNSINEDNPYILNESVFANGGEIINKKLFKSGDNYNECPEGTYTTSNTDGVGCTQVLNECASCQDIYNYHYLKGDFKGMNDTEKNKLMDSYGAGGCSVRTDSTGHGTVRGNFMVYIDKTKSIWEGHIGGDAAPAHPSTKIMDSTGLVTKKTNKRNSAFPNQHNLMAKTPDGNIIDAEKCICPGTKNVKGWMQGGEGHGIAKCA